jgi:hypothetical protein
MCHSDVQRKEQTFRWTILVPISRSSKKVLCFLWSPSSLGVFSNGSMSRSGNQRGNYAETEFDNRKIRVRFLTRARNVPLPHSVQPASGRRRILSGEWRSWSVHLAVCLHPVQRLKYVELQLHYLSCLSVQNTILFSFSTEHDIPDVTHEMPMILTVISLTGIMKLTSATKTTGGLRAVLYMCFTMVRNK